MFLVVVILGPLIGAALGACLGHRVLKWQWPVWASIGLIIAITVVATFASSRWPGPVGRYNYGPGALAAREWLIAPSGYALAVLPMCLSFVTYSRLSIRRWRFVSSAAVGYCSLAIVLPVALFIGCNYAGACL